MGAGRQARTHNSVFDKQLGLFLSDYLKYFGGLDSSKINKLRAKTI